MAQLFLNLDMVAIMRAVRHTQEPDPLQVAVLGELAGVDGISVQLRRDRRFINDRDLYLLKGSIKSRLAIETPPADDTIDRVADIKPDAVILVADHADTDMPFSTIDFNQGDMEFRDIVARLHGVEASVSFLVEPELDQIKGAGKSGADAVMLNTKAYTLARNVEDAQRELDRLDEAANYAARNGLAVQSGPGLTYRNVRPIVETGRFNEFHIGHSIISRALMVGIDRAVRDMREILNHSVSVE